MIQYEPLPSSSIIDLVAPGSPVTFEQIQESVAQVEALGFKSRLRLTGMDCIVSSSSLASGRLKLSKRTLSTDSSLVKRVLMDSGSKAIWCIRGGYGSQKLMPYIIKMKKPMKPKIFIGYSDVTALQIFLNLKWKWPVLHFPVLIHLKDCSAPALKRFQSLLRGSRRYQSFSGLRLLNRESIRPGAVNS